MHIFENRCKKERCSGGLLKEPFPSSFRFFYEKDKKTDPIRVSEFWGVSRFSGFLRYY